MENASPPAAVVTHAPGPYRLELVQAPPGPDGKLAGFFYLIYPEAKVLQPGTPEPANVGVGVVTFYMDFATTFANARLFEKAPELYECLRLFAQGATSASVESLQRLLDYIDKGETNDGQTPTG